MRQQGIALLAAGVMLAAPAWAWQHQELRATYHVYAAGIEFVAAEARVEIGPASYTLDVRYRTIGVLSALYPGQQHNTVTGAWHGGTAKPHRYHGVGKWRGRDYVALIDYHRGQPEIRTLEPPPQEEREPVPAAMRLGSVDILSALTQLIAHVGVTDRCDTAARLYDGRRATAVTARGVGRDILPATSRSSFAGPALRCDFEARVLAGFRLSDDAETRGRPFTGSAWFARPLPDAFPMPVYITFETRALGTARMYLTGLVRERERRSSAAPTLAEADGSRSPPSR